MAMPQDFGSFVSSLLGGAQGAARQASAMPAPLQPDPRFQAIQQIASQLPAQVVQAVAQAAAQPESGRQPLPMPSAGIQQNAAALASGGTGSSGGPVVTGQEAPMTPKEYYDRLTQARQGAYASDPKDVGSGISSVQMGIPTAPVAPPPAPAAPVRAESYVQVAFNPLDGGEPITLMLPATMADPALLPEGARVIGEPFAGNGPEIERAATAPNMDNPNGQVGFLYEQQPQAVQSAFRTPEAASAETLAVSQAELAKPKPPTPAPAVAAPPPSAAYTTEDLRASDQAAAADMLEAANITSVPAGHDAMRAEDGTITIVTNAEAVAVEAAAANGGVPPAAAAPAAPATPPDLTLAELRQTNPALANSLARQGDILAIPVNQMVVEDAQGRYTLVPMADTAPAGTTIATYGGKSAAPNPNMTVGGVLGDLVTGAQKGGDLALQGAGIDPQDAGRAAGVINRAADWARQQSVTGIANVALNIEDAPPIVQTVVDAALAPFAWAEKLPIIQGTPGIDVVVWTRDNPEEAERIAREGYDSDGDGVVDYTGGRAVWEAYSAGQPLLQRIANDILLDPTNYLTGAGGLLVRGGRAIQGTETLVPLWRKAIGSTVEGSGRALRAPDMLVDEALSPAIGRVVNVGKAVGSRIPGVRRLGELSPESLLNVGSEAQQDALNQIIANSDVRGRRAPDDLGIVGPSGAPVTPSPIQPQLLGPDGQPMGPAAAAAPPPARTVVEAVGPDGQPLASAVSTTPPPARPVTEAVSPDGQPLASAAITTPPPVRRAADAPAGTVGTRPIGDNLRTRTEADGTVFVEQRQPDETWTTIATDRTTVADTLVESRTGGDPSDPFAETVLGDERPPEGWGFLSPEERAAGVEPRIVDAAWDRRAQNPEGWEIFKREYGPKAEAYERTQQAARATTGPRKGIDVVRDVVTEARHVIDNVIPAFRTAYGDVAPYRKRYDLGTGPSGAKATYYTTQNREALIERAVFEPSQRNADAAFRAIEDRAFQKNPDRSIKRTASGKPVTNEWVLAQVHDDVAQLRDAYRPIREQLSPQARLPMDETPAAPTTPEPAPAAPEPTAPQAAAAPTPDAPVADIQDRAQRIARGVATEPSPVRPVADMTPADVNSAFRDMDPDDIQVDESRFQPRSDDGVTGLDPDRVRQLADTWNPDQQDAVKVWRDPKDGQTYMLSGHHRQAGLRQAKERGLAAPDATLKTETLNIPEDRAIQVAETANVNRSQQTPFAEYRTYKRRKDSGMSHGEAMAPFANKKKNSFFNDMEAADNLGPDLQRLVDDNYDNAGRLKSDGEKRLTIAKAGVLGRAVQDGTISREAAQSFWNKVADEGMLDSEFAGEISRLRNLHDLSRMGVVTDDASAGQMFSADDVATDEFSAVRAKIKVADKRIRKLKTDAMRNKATSDDLVKSGNKLPPVLRKRRDEIQAEINTLLDDMRMVAQPPAPAPVLSTQYAPEAADMTTAAPQTMDLGEAGRPVMAAGGDTPGEVLTTDDLLDPDAGKTPEQLGEEDRARQKAAGQGSMFSVFFSRNAQAKAQGEAAGLATRDAIGTLAGATINRPVRNTAIERVERERRQKVADLFGRDNPSPMHRRGRVLTEDQEKALSVRFDNAPGPGRSADDLLDPTVSMVESAADRTARLNQSASGETVIDRWSRYANEHENTGMDLQSAEVMAGQRVLNDWKAELLKQRPKRYTRYESRYKELMTAGDARRQKLATNAAKLETRRAAEIAKPTGRTVKQQDAAEARLQKLNDSLGDVQQNAEIARMQDESIATVQAIGHAINSENWAMRGYDTALGILRQMVLYNVVTGPRYIWTQIAGNTISAGLTQNADIIPRALSATNYRAAHESVQDLPARMFQSSADTTRQNLNIANGRRDVVMTVGDQSIVAGSEMRLKTLADRFRLGRLKMPLGRLTGPFANKHVRDLASAVDHSFREALWDKTVSGNMLVARRQFPDIATARLRPGQTREQFDEIWATLPDQPSADDIRLAFEPMGTAYADDISRTWATAIGRSDELARAETNRVFFSGTETNADVILKRVVFFHYWMSRATPLYAQALLKNPGFMNAYLKMTDYMREEAESGDYGDSVKGYVLMMSTPMGFNLFARPDAMLQVFTSYWEDAGYAPDGENRLGSFMRKAGVMFNPLVGTVVNLSGSMGDTFAPDPLMIGNTIRTVETVLNFANAHGMGAPKKPTNIGYSDMMNHFREYTTGALDFLPGIEQIEYRDSAVYAQRTINSLIQDVAEEQGIPLKIENPDDPGGGQIWNPVVLNAYEDPASPLYREAYKRFADQGMLDQVIKLLPTSILYPKSRPIRVDARNAAINRATEGTPEYEALTDERQMANIVDPEARAITAAASDYHGIGTPEEQAANTAYNGIRYGDSTAPVTIGGRTYQPAELAAMEDAQRGMLADTWAAETGNTERVATMREKRDTFKEGSPEWQAHQAWAKSVRETEGGALQWWRDTAKGNPNAARYLETTLAEYSGNVAELDARLLSTTAYMNVIGAQPSYNAPAPISVRDTANVPYMAGEGTGGGAPAQQTYGSGQKGPTEQSIMEDIARYEQDSAVYNQILFNTFGQEVDINSVNPMARAAIISNIERDYGISPPQMRGGAGEYLEWTQAQPGGDTSISAYLEWRNRFKQTTSTGLTVLPGYNAGTVPTGRLPQRPTTPTPVYAP